MRMKTTQTVNKCSICGTALPHNRYGDLCQSCYVYFRNGGILYPKPLVGVVATNEKGEFICHICGKAYAKLGSHIVQSHGLPIKEYKKKFSLADSTSLCEKELKEHLRQSVIDNYDKVVTENLTNKGSASRFKKGCPGRTKDKVSLQTLAQLRQHIAKISKNTSNNKQQL